MGNSVSQPKYLSNSEALEIIGGSKWLELKRKIEMSGSSNIDFDLFLNIIHSRFEKIPKLLVERLFKAFASDLGQRVEVDAFISALAVLGGRDQSNLGRFTFRVYENSGGYVTRRQVEDMLLMAYESKIDQNGTAEQRRLMIDDLFLKGKIQSISVKEFESFRGRWNLFTGWIAKVLQVFVEPVSPRLSALEKKYSSMAQADELVERFNIGKRRSQQIRHLFVNQCTITCAQYKERGYLGKTELSLEG
jgi:Ca2+-binding EF-hand superfamily protein